MKHHTLAPLLAALTLIACSAATSTEARTAALGEEVTLAPGQRAVFPDQKLEVQFIAVTEDSRCPLDTTCVWAGEVIVQLAIRDGDSEAQLAVVAGHGAAHGRWRVSVLSVQPERLSSRPIPATDYRVALKVERLVTSPQDAVDRPAGFAI